MAKTTTSRSRRNNNIPWAGLALLAVGGYLWWKHGQSTASIAPGEPNPAGSPPATTPGILPVSSATSTPLLPNSTAADDRALVMQVAAGDARPNFKVFAQSGDPADITLLANIIRGEWAQNGRCVTLQCDNNWAYIVNKYKIR